MNTEQAEVGDNAKTRPKLDIQREAICLSLKLGMLRTRRKVPTSLISTDADPTLVHVSKEILESDELKFVNRHHDEVKNYLRARCLPSPFRSGVYLIRLGLIPEVMDKLREFEVRHGELVTKFLAFYERVHAERNDESSPFREKLGTLYNAGDYPAPRRVAQAFRFDVQLWELSTPGALRTIDRALYEREAAKMQNVWEEAREQITGVLLQEFGDMTRRMVERLTPEPDGTMRVFRDSLVGNLQEWLDIFDKRALTDDENLVALVQKARSMVTGIQPDVIRDSEGLRKDLASSMAELTTQIDQAIVARPGRLMELEDEEPAR